MANQEQLAILKQGVEVWNKWRSKYDGIDIDLNRAFLHEAYLTGANFTNVNFHRADLRAAKLSQAHFMEANLSKAELRVADLREANLKDANLQEADLMVAKLNQANLQGANLIDANLTGADFKEADLRNADLGGAIINLTDFAGCTLVNARVYNTIFVNSDLSNLIGLENVIHVHPSYISTDALLRSKGKISEVFLRGCGLSDWEIEATKLYNLDLSNEEILNIQYRINDLRTTQPIQVSSLFISYSHADSTFVDKIETYLNKNGVRFWRDIHDMKSGRMEKQIDRAMRLNPTVLLILSEHSLQSDWVEHEVRAARALEKEMKRDVLCPVALDDSWKNSPWAKRIMEQVTEYNILDFSSWKDEAKFGNTFNKLLDGLELFYK